MRDMVKAAVLTAPRSIEVQQFPYPEMPKNGAIIRTELSGICGTDKHTYKGEVRQYAGTPQEITTPFPIIQGHENVGIIEEITKEGSLHLDFDGQILKPGDRVVMCPDTSCGDCWFCKHIPDYPWCNDVRSYGNSFSCANAPHLFGGFSQYMAITDKVKLYKVPEGMKPELAVFAELFDVTYSLDKAKEMYAFDGEGFAFGDTVVILGAGPLGICHMIKARMLGADKVIMTDTSQFRLDIAKQFGADLTLCLADTTEDERVEMVYQMTGGRGADVVVECAGEPEAFPEGLRMVRKAGTYLIVGNFVDVGRSVELKPHELCAKNVRILGMSNHSISGYNPSMRMMQRYQDMYPFEKLITHRMPLEDAKKAIELSMDYSQSMPFMYQWDCYKHLYDTQEAFMVGKEEVYQFVDKILATMSEAIKSRTIHIGMDEAWELGMGQYRVENGFTEKRDLLLTHLQRVVEIAKKYDYTCEIWSDMFYRIVEGSDFDDDGVIPDDVRESIPEGVHLVHWKYEHQETEIVRRQIKQNQAICDDVTFAGCAWKSMGLAPNNQYSIDVMENQLKICREEGVRRYIVTIWSDCGAHCSMFSVLPSLFAATEMARGKSKEEIDKEMFQEIVGVAFDDFMMLDYMNNPFYKETATLNSRCYWGLMSDVLLGSFDLYLDEHTNEAYEKLVEKYASISAGDFGLLFNDFTLYARVLSIKMNLGVRLRRAYREGNKKLLRQYATVDIPKMISYMELYIDNFEKRWMTENMAFALEVHHLYYGGQIERWQYVAERVLQHLEDGNPIEEIEREELPPSLFSEGSEDTLFVLGYERLLSYSEYGR